MRNKQGHVILSLKWTWTIFFLHVVSVCHHYATTIHSSTHSISVSFTFYCLFLMSSLPTPCVCDSDGYRQQKMTQWGGQWRGSRRTLVCISFNVRPTSTLMTETSPRPVATSVPHRTSSSTQQQHQWTRTMVRPPGVFSPLYESFLIYFSFSFHNRLDHDHDNHFHCGSRARDASRVIGMFFLNNLLLIHYLKLEWTMTTTTSTRPLLPKQPPHHHDHDVLNR